MAFTASALISAAVSADGAVTVTNLRIGVHADKVRVVLDADAPLPLSVTATEDGAAVIVELPGVTWRAPRIRQRARGVVAGHAFDDDGVLVLDTTGPARVARAFRLPPDETHLHRLVVDLVADAAAAIPVALPEPSTTATAFETMSVSIAQADTQANPIGDWLRSESSNGNLDKAREGLRQAHTPVPVARVAPPTLVPAPVRVAAPIYNTPASQPSIETSQQTRPAPGVAPSTAPSVDLDFGINKNGGRGAYFAGGLGLGFVTDPELVGAEFSAIGAIDGAFSGYAALGRATGSRLRLEGEFNFTTGELDTLDVSSAGSVTGLSVGDNQLETGSWSVYSVMLNAAYDFETHARIQPYVMAGVGLSFVSAGDVELSGNSKIIDEFGQAFGFQLGAGINMPIDSRLSIDAQYRYFATTDASLKTVSGNDFDASFSNHAIMFGARYRL